MFCPKCGTKNPDNGKFCRSCGTDINVVSAALTGKLDSQNAFLCTDKKGKPISWESAFGKLFTGLAFVGVTIALANSAMGTGWWFWMLIPAITMIGAGVAQIVQIKTNEKAKAEFSANVIERELFSNRMTELPPNQTEYISPVADTEYKTGDLVPPSVTDNTTRHLEMDSEGETMTLPKSNL
jgi:rRNA maturation endonuclease Nob1